MIGQVVFEKMFENKDQIHVHRPWAGAGTPGSNVLCVTLVISCKFFSLKVSFTSFAI